jgi:alpha/beta superfamily hydrolase
MSTTGRLIELHTSDGETLVAELAIPDDVRGAAVLLHPHPLNGGNKESSLTGALFGALPGHGVAVLRFDFRGVGRSTGRHGGGVDEALDAQAALDALAPEVEGVPLILAGWSFGAEVALQVVDERLAGWSLVAPPLAIVPPEAMVAADDPRPKQLLVPEQDQYCPPDRAREATAGWVDTRLEVIAGADHFLVGRTDAVVAPTIDFLDALPRRLL